MSREIDSLDRIAAVLRSSENQKLLNSIIEECDKAPFTWQMDNPTYFNKWRTPEGIEYWRKALEQEINELLNVNVQMPEVKVEIPTNLSFIAIGAGMYDTKKKRIMLYSINSAYTAIEALAHECYHYIQDLKEYNWFSNDPLYDSTLCEGFADAAAIASIGNYAEKTGNLMLKCHALKSAQEHMEFCRDYCADNIPTAKTHNHVGATAFILAEARRGRGVYEKALKSKDPAGALVEMLGERR